MKQRITVGQLNKLPDAHKERLREWWTPEYGDYYIFKYEGKYWHDAFLVDQMEGYQNYSNENGEDPVPLLNIGQMIQFIEEKRPIKGISKNRFDKWFISIETAQFGYKDELCDSLWEATTQLLKNAYPIGQRPYKGIYSI